MFQIRKSVTINYVTFVVQNLLHNIKVNNIVLNNLTQLKLLMSNTKYFPHLYYNYLKLITFYTTFDSLTSDTR